MSLGLRVRHDHAGLDPADPPDRALVDDSRMQLGQRVVAVVERLHHHEAGARRRPAATASASSAFAVNGFSHSTCLPASSAAIVHCPCSPFGSGL